MKIPPKNTMGLGCEWILYCDWFRNRINIKYDGRLPGGAMDCDSYLFDKYVFYWENKPEEHKRNIHSAT